jgi:hypothetical protein
MFTWTLKAPNEIEGIFEMGPSLGMGHDFDID